MPWTKYFPLDFFFGISRKEKEEILGVDRVVSVTEAATEKGKSQDVQAATESVFSGPALPQAFYRSFLKAHSVKAVCLGGCISCYGNKSTLNA
jgi:hypothetical protein